MQLIHIRSHLCAAISLLAAAISWMWFRSAFFSLSLIFRHHSVNIKIWKFVCVCIINQGLKIAMRSQIDQNSQYNVRQSVWKKICIWCSMRFGMCVYAWFNLYLISNGFLHHFSCIFCMVPFILVWHWVFFWILFAFLWKNDFYVFNKNLIR